MQVWDSLINAICRPYRINYKSSELLGGTNGLATISRTKIKRQDFVITNKRDERLECSFWEPHDATSTKKLPAVVYCHCNSGSRLDAAEAIHIVLPMGVRVFALDFSGSGISEGEYVTLGANEVEDLSCLVDFIRSGGHTTTLALWGRSMGAVTSLLYSERDPSVAGLVLDSPFSKLTDLMRELAQQQRIPMWNMIGGTAMKLMRRSVRKRAGFDINNITPVEMVPRSYVPAFFGHAKGDTFVRPHHSKRLHSEYAGDKEIMLFENCDHNSPRPFEFYEASANFLARALHVDFDMQMLPSMMSDTSMLMPDAGQTHSIMPCGTLPFDSAHIPREAEGESTSQDLNGAGVDLELQQALALSLESCAIAESVLPCNSQRSSDRQSRRSRGVKEQTFGWGSPDQKVPARTAVASAQGDGQCASASRHAATGDERSPTAAVPRHHTSLTRGALRQASPAAVQREPGGSGAAFGKVAGRRRVFDAAQQDNASLSPVGPKAHHWAGSQSRKPAAPQAQPTQPHPIRDAAVAAASSAARSSASVQHRSTRAAAQTALGSHLVAAPAKPTPLARSPAVSPAKRHSVLPQELAKSTTASVWNLYPDDQQAV